MDIQSSILRLNALTQNLLSIHPGDKVRVKQVVDEFVRIFDEILMNENLDSLVETKLGELLNNLEKSQYYAFSEIAAKSKFGMKINDLIQKYKWKKLQGRLSRSRS